MTEASESFRWRENLPSHDPAHLEILKQGRDAWNSWRKAYPEIVPQLSRIDFADRSQFEGTSIWGPPVWFPAGRQRLSLAHFNFRGTSFVASRLNEADLAGADLSFADLSWANLTDATLGWSNITGADLRGSRWSGANVSDIRYSRKHLRGKCYSVGGIAETQGDAQFRRDVLDQDYIDTKVRAWSHSWWKRVFLLWPWRAIDYGRSLSSVFILSVIIVSLFGLAYPVLQSSGDISFTGNIGADNAFRPFYAAAISFSTLGFTDIVVGESLVGQIVLMANVLLGYVTLGLLLAILANGVARRA
jgi:hypothetical protein